MSNTTSDDILPKASFGGRPDALTLLEGFWLVSRIVDPATTLRSNFDARDDDVVLASTIKTGTTWLKALSHSILRKGGSCDPLTTDNPHTLVPTIEFESMSTNTKLDIYDASAPRLLHTHLPYSILPGSVKNSACKIVYIARNPKDTLISMWHFINGTLGTGDRGPLSLDEALDYFCSGVHPYGPFSDHVAEYWLESRTRPEKVLFVKYEELKSDPKREVSRIAEFLGRPLTEEGEAEELLWRCSLERLKNLEVNSIGHGVGPVPNAAFFRKGQVGDWKNYLTSEMEARVHQTIGLKLEALGLFF